MDFTKITPQREINAKRTRGHGSSASDAPAHADSIASTLKQKIVSATKKARKTGHTLAGRHGYEPFPAFNNARVGISVKSLEELERLAYVRLPNPHRTREQIVSGENFNVDARLALAYPEGATQLSINDDCLVAFADRFYRIDEISILIHAIRKNGHYFHVMAFDGQVYTPDGNLVGIINFPDLPTLAVSG